MFSKNTINTKNNFQMFRIYLFLFGLIILYLGFSFDGLGFSFEGLGFSFECLKIISNLMVCLEYYNF